MNVLLCPQDERFRRINTQNKVFLTKVQPAKGALDFLCSVGFRQTAADPAVLSLDRTIDGVSSSSSGPALSAAQLARLEEGWEALQAALTELGVPAAERPADPSLTAAGLRAEREARAQAQQQVQQQVAFDPFRAHIVRAAPQVGSIAPYCIVTAKLSAPSAAFTRGRWERQKRRSACLQCGPATAAANALVRHGDSAVGAAEEARAAGGRPGPSAAVH
jgi:hypothetical protein